MGGGPNNRVAAVVIMNVCNGGLLLTVCPLRLAREIAIVLEQSEEPRGRKYVLSPRRSGV
jgi:hypothetical protein